MKPTGPWLTVKIMLPLYSNCQRVASEMKYRFHADWYPKDVPRLFRTELVIYDLTSLIVFLSPPQLAYICKTK